MRLILAAEVAVDRTERTSRTRRSRRPWRWRETRSRDWPEARTAKHRTHHRILLAASHRRSRHLRRNISDYLAWVVPGCPDIPVTQHLLGQSVIDLYTDTALLETHVLAYHRVSAESEHRDIVIGGRYLDWMDKIDNEWRISRRTMVYDWVEDLGESVNWTTGLMGMPFDANRYAGRAAGDYSEGFFDDRWTSVTEDTIE
jgi:hypothetical protein